MAKSKRIRDQLESMTDEELQKLLDAETAATTPQDGALPQSAEDQSQGEMSEVLAGIQQRGKDEQNRRDAATQTEFWAQLVFGSKVQRDAFFEGLKASHLLDDQWVDGQALAKHLGIELPDCPKFSTSTPTKSWNEFVNGQRSES